MKAFVEFTWESGLAFEASRVSRFQGSHDHAAVTDANLGIKSDTRKFMELVWC